LHFADKFLEGGEKAVMERFTRMPLGLNDPDAQLKILE